VTSLNQNVTIDANVDYVFLALNIPMTYHNISKTTLQMSKTPTCMVDSISTHQHLVVYNDTSKTSHHMDRISSQLERLGFYVKENSIINFPTIFLMFEAHTFNPIFITWLCYRMVIFDEYDGLTVMIALIVILPLVLCHGDIFAIA
jgi:hypothetical protein